jgi:hypothetical protein
MHTWRAIQLPRRGVNGPHARQQVTVSLRMGRWRAFTPSVITCRGDAEHARHGGNGERGLVRAHEPEEPDDTAPVSRANQAAAFERLSRSSLSWRTSRRSLTSSSRSALDVGSTTGPCKSPSVSVRRRTRYSDWEQGRGFIRARGHEHRTSRPDT